MIIKNTLAKVKCPQKRGRNQWHCSVEMVLLNFKSVFQQKARTGCQYSSHTCIINSTFLFLPVTLIARVLNPPNFLIHPISISCSSLNLNTEHRRLLVNICCMTELNFCNVLIKLLFLSSLSSHSTNLEKNEN